MRGGYPSKDGAGQVVLGAEALLGLSYVPSSGTSRVGRAVLGRTGPARWMLPYR